MNEYKFEDIKLGLEHEFEVELTQEKMDAFLSITEDINPLHNNKEFALSKGYEDKVVYGMLTSSFLSTLAGVYLPGKYSLIHSVDILFKKPVYLKDSPLTIKGKVIDKNDIFKEFTIKYEMLNNNNVKVTRGTMKVGLLDE